MIGKNLYLLGLQKAFNSQPDIHEMIQTLESEIARGRPVYTSAELAILEKKLADCRDLLKVLTLP